MLMFAWPTAASQAADRGTPWTRHIVDASSAGADGVRLDDVNGDGLLDIATGWEEGGRVRAYLHPGFNAVREPWPGVTVGSVTDSEDAVFVDLDGDGIKDAVSCAEGNTRGVFVHWAPSRIEDYLRANLWQTVKIPASSGLAWMFAVPMDVDGRNGIDLVAGCKWGGKIAWFESPAANRRDLSQWNMHVMSGVGWTMSLIPQDVDGDSDLDVIVTDRYNDVGLQAARWLENPGTGTAAQKQPWPNHVVGAVGREVMLSSAVDLDRDGLLDLIVPIRAPGSLLFFRRTHPSQNLWQEYPIAVPANVGTPKAVNVGDIDLDGKLDMVMSFAAVPAGGSGMVWMSYANHPTDSVWQDHEISGIEGVKFDIVALHDLDGDGDLDVLTTEEVFAAFGLGVVWYENPTRGFARGDFDQDEDIDQSDFAHLQACLTGPGIPVTDVACKNAALDADSDIDLDDVEWFYSRMTGPIEPAAAGQPH